MEVNSGTLLYLNWLRKGSVKNGLLVAGQSIPDYLYWPKLLIYRLRNEAGGELCTKVATLRRTCHLKGGRS